MNPEIGELHAKLKALLDALDKHDLEVATQQALDLQESFQHFLGEWISEEPGSRVIRAIADLKMREIQGNGFLVQQVFDNLIVQFDGRYPEHKLLTHWCQEARDPKEISGSLLPRLSKNENGD